MANHTTEIFISDEKFYPRREIFIYDEKILTPREQSVAMEISDRCRRRLLETSNKKKHFGSHHEPVAKRLVRQR
jgi:hypothetical protein